MDTFMTGEILGIEFTFSRVAFEIGGFQVYWYGILIAMGFLLAIIYAFRRAPYFGIKQDPMIDVVLVGSVCAIICARAYYVLTSLNSYHSFKEAISIHDGGLAIYGAVIGAVVFGGLMCRLKKVNMPAMFDLAGIGLLLGQAIGRWGNFINQEAFGNNTSSVFGMISNGTIDYLSKPSVQVALAEQGVTVDPLSPVHPCFLYESIWCFTGFILLHFLSKHRTFRGETFLQYIVWYGLGRFFIESVRTDSLMIGSLKISQLVAAICVFGGALAIVIIRSKVKKNGTALDNSMKVPAPFAADEVSTHLITADETACEAVSNKITADTVTDTANAADTTDSIGTDNLTDAAKTTDSSDASDSGNQTDKTDAESSAQSTEEKSQ